MIANPYKKLEHVYWTLMVIVFILPQTAFAALPGRESAKQAADRAGLSTDESVSMLTIVGGIISSLLGALGIVFLILVIYSGFLWMTAQGNEEQVKKAKGILTTSVIGLLIVFAAFGISTFVFEQILQSTIAPT